MVHGVYFLLIKVGFCMLQLWIRYTSILLCSDYIYKKLLTIRNSSKFQKGKLLLCSFPFFLLFSYLPESIQYLSYALLLLFHFVYYGITTRTYNDTIFVTLLLSYGIGYCVFLLSGFISTLILGMIGWFLLNKIQFPGIIIQLTVCLFMYLFCPLPFRIARLKKGMPFLKNQHITSLGSLLGLSVLLCTMLVSSQNFKSDSYYQWALILFLFSFILFLFLFTWWRSQLHRTYLEQLKKRDIKRLEEELQDCQKTIASLKQENQNLAKLIHRDNKQVAALELAVETFLTTSTEEYEYRKEIGEKLLLELQKENDGRKQLVSDLSNPSNLYTTNILSVDCLLNYMLHKGQTNGIVLDFSLTGNIHYFLEQMMEEQDFLTLLADLLENALIATKHGNGTHILLHIGIINESYSISVWDSGIPFTKETLFHLGKKQYTTHKKDGGSGIGLMSTYELLQKYHASLHIEECLSSENLYTKKVSVLFDEKEEYYLYTKRDAKELSYLRQRNDLYITTLV